MILLGPNKDDNPMSFQAEMDFENFGSEKCMLEFFTHKPDEMYTVILLKSGTLQLNGCIISLDGIFKETYRKVVIWLNPEEILRRHWEKPKVH